MRAEGYFQTLSNRGDLRSSPTPSTPWLQVAQGRWGTGQGVGTWGGEYHVHPGLEVGPSLATSTWKPTGGPEQLCRHLPERPLPHGEQAVLRKGWTGSWFMSSHRP